MTILVIILLLTTTATSRYPSYFTWTDGAFEAHNLTSLINRDALAFMPGFYNFTAQREHALYSGKDWGSQCGQDVTVVDVLNGKKRGFFVDLASNAWSKLSNTILLEVAHQWRGLCLEPNPEYLRGLLENRRCIVVTNPVSRRMNDTVVFRFDEAMSGIVASEMDNLENDAAASRRNKTERTLTTVTLAAVLQRFNAPHDIDYLSLDVEGAEALVLENFDFKRYRFRTITVERPTLIVHTILVRNGYWWLAKLSNFGEHMYITQHLAAFDIIMQRYGDDRNNAVWERQRPDSNCQYADHPWIRVPVWIAGGNHSLARAGGLQVLRNDDMRNTSVPASCVPPPPPTPKRGLKADMLPPLLPTPNRGPNVEALPNNANAATNMHQLAVEPPLNPVAMPKKMMALRAAQTSVKSPGSFPHRPLIEKKNIQN